MSLCDGLWTSKCFSEATPYQPFRYGWIAGVDGNCVFPFPGGSHDKESTCQCRGDIGSMPGSRRSSRRGNGNLLQYPWQKNPIDRGDCRLQSIVLQRVGWADTYTTPRSLRPWWNQSRWALVKWFLLKADLTREENMMLFISWWLLCWKHKTFLYFLW